MLEYVMKHSVDKFDKQNKCIFYILSSFLLNKRHTVDLIYEFTQFLCVFGLEHVCLK